MRPSAKEMLPSPEDAVLFRKAADYCAFQEHCISEVRQKLRLWGAEQPLANSIIERLLKEGFINEQRYAEAFARGKFKNLKWGRIKIRMELKKKQIHESKISAALKEISNKDYKDCIRQLAKKKRNDLKGDNRENRMKIFRFLLGKGFEAELIREFIPDSEE